MTLLYLAPAADLSPFIDHYFIYEIDEQTVAREFPNGMRILPSTYGRMGLFFGKPTIKRVAGKIVGTNPPIGVSGFYTEPRNYITQQAVSMLIVGFTPVGLQQLLTFPLSEITNQNVDARDLFPEYGRLLHDVYSSGDWSSRVHALNHFFRLKFAATKLDQRATQALNCILAMQGRLSMKETAAELSVSQRTLRRLVRRHVGISPKTFASLVRFQAATRQIVQTNPTSLTDLAHQTGYYDQAHFNHEFARYFGGPPGTFTQLRRSVIGRFFDHHHLTNPQAIVAYV